MFINQDTEYVVGKPSRYTYGKLGDDEKSQPTFWAAVPMMLAIACVTVTLLMPPANKVVVVVAAVVWFATVVYFGAHDFVCSRSESLRTRYRRRGVLLVQGDDLFDLINLPQVRRRVAVDKYFRARVDSLALGYQRDAMNDSPRTLVDKLFYLVDGEVWLSPSLAIIRDGLSANNAKEFERNAFKVLASRLADEVQTERAMSKHRREAGKHDAAFRLERLERYLAAAVHSSSS